FQCIVKDIMERKKAEMEAKKSELEKEENQYRLQSILDNAALIVYIKDLEGRYTLINKLYKDIYQFTEEQAIGKTDFELLPEAEAQRNYDIEQYVIREQKTIEMEETISRSGSPRNLLMVRFPLFDKNQKIYGITGIATDMTERFLYGKHLIEEKSKAEMAEQLQEQFLANMSHEIRTPMNGIIGMTNILSESPLNDEQREFVQVIKKSSDNLLVLINDILDISKIKAGKLRIEKIDFFLRETVENTLIPFNVKIMEKGLKLGFVVDRNIPDSLVGDPHRLNQILTNLLGNAIKFTEKGEINLEIKLLNRQTDSVSLEFSVSDTGIGIFGDKLQYIFESFTQAETGITRKFGGTGLGLSITRKLIELQRGTIDVTSMPDKGTTFTFVLSYTISKQKKSTKKQQQNLELDNGESFAGKKILLVEDNETNRKVIYHMLKKFGIQVQMVCNGKEAVKLLTEGHSWDLIIMDLQMPEMDGFETTKYIRQKLNLTTPIIAMTASALRNEKAKCFELGMNEYLTKPFVPANLYFQLKRFLFSNDVARNDVQDKAADNDKEIFKPYNLAHLIELDDIDCMCEVLQLFLESTPVSLNEISAGIKVKNWDLVYKQSHKLKSSLGLLQMDEFLSVITRIELNAKEIKNLDSIPDDFRKAEKLFDEVKPMIETELKEAVETAVKN
ncbi:MAG TPA: response regulator, partial [Chitinophagaceae bacterium]|nr:response regulator [Chitinophagaceae bacterium]